MFGWTGIACVEGTEFSSFGIIVLSSLAGIAMMVVMGAIFYSASKMTSSGNINIKNAIGTNATVYVPIPERRTGYGKINVTINYYYLGKPDLQGTPFSFELTVQNDGSYNESGFYYYLLILVFLVLIIFLVIRFARGRFLIKKI